MPFLHAPCACPYALCFLSKPTSGYKADAAPPLPRTRKSFSSRVGSSLFLSARDLRLGEGALPLGAAGVNKAVEAPEEESLTAPSPTKCYTKKVGEDATLLESAKDYFNQFKETPAETRWICIKNRVRAAGDYVSQKTSSKVEPEMKDGTPEAGVETVPKDDGTPEAAKPAAVGSK